MWLFTVPSGSPVRSATCPWVRSWKNASSRMLRWGCPSAASSASARPGRTTLRPRRAARGGPSAGRSPRRWAARCPLPARSASATSWRQMPTSQAGERPGVRPVPPRDRPGGDEDLLRDVLGVRPPAERAAGQAVDDPGPPRVRLRLERALVPRGEGRPTSCRPAVPGRRAGRRRRGEPGRGARSGLDTRVTVTGPDSDAAPSPGGFGHDDHVVPVGRRARPGTGRRRSPGPAGTGPARAKSRRPAARSFGRAPGRRPA